MLTHKISLTLLLGGVGVLGCAIFGFVPKTFGATMPIPSLYEPTSLSRLETLPHRWSMKVWQGIGQVQVVQEDPEKSCVLKPSRDV